MSTISVLPFLQKLVLCPAIEHLTPNSTIEDRWTYKVKNLTEPTLGELYVTFACKPVPNPKQGPRSTLGGRLWNRRLLGFGGWCWSGENEASFTVSCWEGCRPVDALKELIVEVACLALEC